MRKILLAAMLFGLWAHGAEALQVTLAWNYTQGVVPAQSFVVYRAPTCAGTFAGQGEVVWPTLNFVDATVVLGNTYCWRVTAKSAQGLESPPSNTVLLPLSPPTAPVGLSVSVTP